MIRNFIKFCPKNNTTKSGPNLYKFIIQTKCLFIFYKMGSKCFRPINENRQPVYVTSLHHAFDAANLVSVSKNSQKATLIQEITKNQQRKGNLKKLFDHLNSHQKNILPAIKECNKKTTFERSFPAVVVSNMFCEQLIKMLSDKKTKFLMTRTQNSITETTSKLKNQSFTDQLAFRNMIHEIESYFFQLVTKILVYNKEKTIKNSISETLIKYSGIFDGKITAKKELKSILDLYLTVVFQKNIQLIDKNSFLPFYAYSTLLSKSKSQLLTADFIDKHFNFILKLFFELQDTKDFNRTLIESQDFDLFQHSVQSIIKEFIIFSSQNKKMKDYILREIMFEEDAENFDPQKTKKLQKLIDQSLDSYSREHFMFDWLGYLIRYISSKQDNKNDSIKDSFMESLQEVHLPNVSSNTMKNSASVESKRNSIETLKRWFTSQYLNTQKTLEYFSSRIFEALLLNLYNPQQNHQQVINKSKEVLKYFLQRKPKKLSQILTILNKQLRKNKNQYFFTEHHNLSANLGGGRKQLVIVEQQAVEGLWKNDINFIVQGLSIKDSQVILNPQQIEQIFSPIIKSTKPSINLVYLIQLAGISLKYSDLENQKVQLQVYNFLISLTGSLKVSDSQIDQEFVQKFVEKIKFLLHELALRNQAILYSFLKYNFKNLLKEDKSDEVWAMILALVILINIVMEQGENKNSSRSKKLSKFLQEVLTIVKRQKSDPEKIYQVYTQNKNLFDLTQSVSAHLQKIKLKTLQHFELNNQPVPKSMSNIENSVLSSRLQVSESNPDLDFKNIYEMIFKK